MLRMRCAAVLMKPWARPITLKRLCRHLYHCNYCQKDISHVVRVKCAVCADFDLCLECFSAGVELLPHRNDHAYRLVDNLSFPLYEPDWGVMLIPPRNVPVANEWPLMYILGSD